DYDNDGDWDLFSANLAHPRYIQFSDRSMLFEQHDGYFADVRSSAGIRFEETHSNPLWGDFNNDGWLDLYITSIYSDRRSFLYLNMGNGTFEDVTWLSGARVFNGWGAAAADYNLDGRLDLAVGSGDGPSLLENVTAGGNWMLVNVDPPEGINPSGIGCTVTLEQQGVTLMRQVEGGSGTTSQNGGTLHFGLPSDLPCTVRLYAPGDTIARMEIYRLPGSLIHTGD
ncbi:MAG: CRTAC1 family protein, partial [Candidatus Fermentibacteria bacterium]